MIQTKDDLLARTIKEHEEKYQELTEKYEASTLACKKRDDKISSLRNDKKTLKIIAADVKTIHLYIYICISFALALCVSLCF